MNYSEIPVGKSRQEPEDCGCRAIEAGEEGVTVDFCDLHESAPALLEALEAFYSRECQFTRKGRNPDNCETPEHIQAREAIKAARGEAAGPEGGRR